MADQTIVPVKLVANTGRPIWSARTKEMTPPSIADDAILLIYLSERRGFQPPYGSLNAMEKSGQNYGKQKGMKDSCYGSLQLAFFGGINCDGISWGRIFWRAYSQVFEDAIGGHNDIVF